MFGKRIRLFFSPIILNFMFFKEVPLSDKFGKRTKNRKVTLLSEILFFASADKILILKLILIY